MLCCFSGTTYDVITLLICIIQKREYLQNEKRYSKNENAILLYSEKPFKQAAIIFYFIGTLIRLVFAKEFIMIRFGSLERDYSLSKGSLRSRTISASMFNVIAIRRF